MNSYHLEVLGVWYGSKKVRGNLPYNRHTDRKLGCYYIRNHPRFSACPSFEVLQQENLLVSCCNNQNTGGFNSLLSYKPGKTTLGIEPVVARGAAPEAGRVYGVRTCVVTL